MTEEYGPPIAVNGKRPEWLGDDERCEIFDRPTQRWLGPQRAACWNWDHIDQVRLRADHPYYQSAEYKAATGFIGEDDRGYVYGTPVFDPRPAMTEAEMIAALEATGHTVTPPDDQGMTVINTLEGGQTKTTIVAENFSVEVLPSWALDKAANMAGWDCWAAVPAKNHHLIDSIGAHARTLSKHETPPDPLVAEREFLAGLFESFKLSNRARLIRDGVDDTVVPAAMAYLRANKGRL